MADSQTLRVHLDGEGAGATDHVPCPGCQLEGRGEQCALSLRDDDGRLVLHCANAGCSVAAIRDVLRILLVIDGRPVNARVMPTGGQGSTDPGDDPKPLDLATAMFAAAGSNAEAQNPLRCDNSNEKEQSGALVDAAGPVGFETNDVPQGYRNREAAVTALGHAIADCNPADAGVLMAAALDHLSIGWPISPLFGLKEEADFWARTAVPHERKIYMLACYDHLSAAEQAAALRYFQRRVA